MMSVISRGDSRKAGYVSDDNLFKYGSRGTVVSRRTVQVSRGTARWQKVTYGTLHTSYI